MRVSRGIQVGCVVGVLALGAWAIPATADETPGPAKTASSGPHKPITDPREQALYAAQDRFDPVLAAYPKADAGAVWDLESQTLTFRLVSNSDGAKARAAIEALGLPVRVAFAPAAASTRDLTTAAGRIIASQRTWAPGLQGLSYAAPDEVRGRLILGVDKRYVSQWQSAVNAADLGVPVTVRGEAQVGLFESDVRLGTTPLNAP